MWWTVLTSCAVPATAPPVQPPTPPPGQEALGGFVIGSPFNPDGFTCETARCEKPGTIAGVDGTLIVRSCGTTVFRVGFQRSFYVPDTVSAQLHRPGQGDFVPWLMGLGAALKAAGFVRRDPTADELEVLTAADGAAQVTAGGIRLDEPTYLYFDHPDGRSRLLTVLALPGAAEAVAIDQNASLLEATLTTIPNDLCTIGI